MEQQSKRSTALARNIDQCLQYIPWTVADFVTHSALSKRTVARWRNDPSVKPKPSYLAQAARTFQAATGKRITHRDLLDPTFDIDTAPGANG